MRNKFITDEADGMFEMLGYTKFENKDIIEYRLNEDEGMTSIIFNKTSKTFCKHEFYRDSGHITSLEFIAIITKYDELGWTHE